MRLPKQAKPVMRKGSMSRIEGGVVPSLPSNICDICRKHPSMPMCQKIRCLPPEFPTF
jgi:hypothetical protein